MKSKHFFEKKIVIAILITVFVISILGIGWIALSLLEKGSIATSTNLPSPTAIIETSDPIATIQITPADTPTLTATPNTTNPNPPTSVPVFTTGAIILSMRDGNYYHLYYYSECTTLCKTDDGTWDDVSPAANPMGRKLFTVRTEMDFGTFTADLVREKPSN